MPDVQPQPKPKPWWRSKRFWLGASSILGGGGAVCNLVAGGNQTVSAVGVSLAAVGLALRYWFGEKDGATPVAYPKVAGAIGDSLNRVDAARGFKAKLTAATASRWT